MAEDDADDLVQFSDVSVITSTVPALLFQIGKRSVWLPRGHISGKLWCTGDRGRLFIRRWVARDRNLLDLHGEAIASPAPTLSRARLLGQLPLVRGNREPHRAQ